MSGIVFINYRRKVSPGMAGQQTEASVFFGSPSREGRSVTGFRKIRSNMATRMRITDAMAPRLRACVRELRDCKDEHEIEEQFYEGDLAIIRGLRA